MDKNKYFIRPFPLEKTNERGPSHFLVLACIRGVLENYNGSMEIDKKTNAIICNIPINEHGYGTEGATRLIKKIVSFMQLFPLRNVIFALRNSTAALS